MTLRRSRMGRSVWWTAVAPQAFCRAEDTSSPSGLSETLRATLVNLTARLARAPILAEPRDISSALRV